MENGKWKRTLPLQRVHQFADALERALEVLRMGAEADSQVAVHREVVSRHHEHALLDAQAFHEDGRVDGMLVLHEGDGARVRRDMREEFSLLEPRPHDRVVRTDDAARPGEEAVPARWRERDACKP